VKKKRQTADFDSFKVYFREYQRLFGLTGYKVYFKHEALEDSFAEIAVQQADRVATVAFNSELPDKDALFKDIRRSAKHEALHLMLNKLESLAKSRYLLPGDIYEASEEIVCKLEELID